MSSFEGGPQVTEPQQPQLLQEFTFVPDLSQDEEVVYKFIEGLSTTKKEQLAFKFINEMAASRQDGDDHDHEVFAEKMEGIEDSILRDIQKSQSKYRSPEEALNGSFSERSDDDDDDDDDIDFFKASKFDAEDMEFDDIERMSEDLVAELDKFMADLEAEQAAENQKTISLSMAGKMLMKLAQSRRKVAASAGSDADNKDKDKDGTEEEEEEEEKKKSPISLRTAGMMVMAMSRMYENRQVRRRRTSSMVPIGPPSSLQAQVSTAFSALGSVDEQQECTPNQMERKSLPVVTRGESPSSPHHNGQPTRRFSKQTSIGLMVVPNLEGEEGDNKAAFETESSSAERRSKQEELLALLPRYWGSTINPEEMEQACAELPTLTREQSDEVREGINSQLTLKAAGMVFLSLARHKKMAAEKVAATASADDGDDEPTKEQTDFVNDVIKKQSVNEKKQSSTIWSFFASIFHDESLSEELKGCPNERLHLKEDPASGKVQIVAETSGYRVVAK